MQHILMLIIECKTKFVTTILHPQLFTQLLLIPREHFFLNFDMFRSTGKGVMFIMKLFWILYINFQEISLFLLILLRFYKLYPINKRLFIQPFEGPSREILAHRPTILVIAIYHEYVRDSFTDIKVLSKSRMIGSCQLISYETYAPINPLSKNMSGQVGSSSFTPLYLRQADHLREGAV